jgi:hypothetical protein
MAYQTTVVLLLLVFPIFSVGTEAALSSDPDLWWLIGKWFVFWGVGVRLFAAGVMQTLTPDFTASGIFGIEGRDVLPVVREVGFGNLAMGTLGLATLLLPDWVVPAAFVGGLYYGLAGLGHMYRGARTAKEGFALASDLAIFAVLAAFVAVRLW